MDDQKSIKIALFWRPNSRTLFWGLKLWILIDFLLFFENPTLEFICVLWYETTIFQKFPFHFLGAFFLNFARFCSHFGSQNGQNSIKKRSPKTAHFRERFKRIFGRFWLPKWLQNASKNRSKIDRGASRGARRAPGPPRERFRATFGRFFDDFCRFLVDFWLICRRFRADLLRFAALCCALLRFAAPCCALLRVAAPCCAFLRFAARSLRKSLEIFCDLSQISTK